MTTKTKKDEWVEVVDPEIDHLHENVINRLMTEKEVEWWNKADLRPNAKGVAFTITRRRMHTDGSVTITLKAVPNAMHQLWTISLYRNAKGDLTTTPPEQWEELEGC